ncbi:MAG: DUF2252 domain-containing protein, partial [Acidobacteriaceae bacterium]|nr:DUF2252 domain-containing protein [Acidobacteriaceae bacterium]
DIEVQLCGDAHVQNLGSFAGPDGRLVFDFNDFDETIEGPWEWDVKRMAASIVLAGREANHRHATYSVAVEAFVQRYSTSMEQFAGEPILQVARHQTHRQQQVKPITAALRQSQRATPCDLLRKLTTPDEHGTPRFRDKKPVFWRVTDHEAEQVLRALDLYYETLRPESQRMFHLFRPIDVGFKVVGTGSVGMRNYVVLMEGNGPADPLFLQLKQEVASAYNRYRPHIVHEHQGRRAAQGQRSIQPISDLLLGWSSMGGHDFLVRQLNDHKGSIDLEQLKGSGLESLAEVAGELMARGHARSGDACMITGYCGSGAKVSKAIRDFAIEYADQTEADFAAFQNAIKANKVHLADLTPAA